VTIGLGSMIDIDVDIGDTAQVGALSLVPKHSRLDARRRLRRDSGQADERDGAAV
jgi:carbonic anhydrase/acetyltransferase-like protein (isoleucine patch superfamily)